MNKVGLALCQKIVLINPQRMRKGCSIVSRAVCQIEYRTRSDWNPSTSVSTMSGRRDILSRKEIEQIFDKG